MHPDQHHIATSTFRAVDNRNRARFRSTSASLRFFRRRRRALSTVRGDYAFIAPDIVEQTITRLDAPASRHKRPQEFKFKAGELTRFPLTDTSWRAASITSNRPPMFFLSFVSAGALSLRYANHFAD